MLGSWAQLPPACFPIDGVEIVESLKESDNVVRAPSMDDVEVESRNRGALKNSGHPTNDYESHLVSSENAQEFCKISLLHVLASAG